MSMILSYQTKLPDYQEKEAILKKMASFLSSIERALFADYAKKKNLSALKTEYLKKYQITARQFNAIRISLEGKIESIVQIREEQMTTLRDLLIKLNKRIPRLKKAQDLYRCKKKVFLLEKKLEGLIEDKKLGKVRLCFGSKKKFHAQYHLKENGYTSHQEWKEDWIESRDSSFFTLGSKDESCGNQTCQATIAEDGSLTIKLRLPDALVKEKKYLTFENVIFPYGHEVIVAALKNCQQRHKLQSEKDPSYIHYGQPISYRFKLEKGKCTLFASTAMAAPCLVTHKERGVIGIDINADHLAMAELDCQGNCIDKKSFPLPLYGKTSDQREALIGDVVAQIVDHAIAIQKPLVVEYLNFEEKKKELHQSKNFRYCRMLSSFIYRKILSMIDSRAYRKGVEVFSVNPAFTSLLGRIKYAVRFGLTVHESAAFCIGRRGMGFSEKVPCQVKEIPDGKGRRIAFLPPARKRKQSQFSYLRQVNKKCLAELAAHFRVIQKESIHKATQKVA